MDCQQSLVEFDERRGKWDRVRRESEKCPWMQGLQRRIYGRCILDLRSEYPRKVQYFKRSGYEGCKSFRGLCGRKVHFFQKVEMNMHYFSPEAFFSEWRSKALFFLQSTF